MSIQIVRTIPTVYVDPTNGSVGGTGSSSDPVTTLAIAAAILRDRAIGGTIKVKSTLAAPATGAVLWEEPWDLTIEGWDVATWYATDAVTVGGDGLVTLTGPAVLSAAGQHVVFVGALTGEFGTTGRLVATDIVGTSSAGSVWQSDNVWTSMDLTRCVGRDCGNDGFAADGDVAGVMTLTDCESFGNVQEGASPHRTAVLNIVGGSFHDNGESGMHAVTSSVCNISGGATFYNNGFSSEDPDVVGNAGVKYRDNASGSIGDGTELYGNHGPGIDIDTTGTVTLGAYDSHDNGLADDIT